MKARLGKYSGLRSTTGRLKNSLSGCITTLSLISCLFTVTFAASASTIPGDIYVYTSPGNYIDITAEYHEDPIILLNGVEVEIYPNYSNGLVYNGSGDVLGFIAAPD